MPERQYLCIDQNNAESKVMPIPSQKILQVHRTCMPEQMRM